MDKQLVALYELKRQSPLLGYIQNRDHFSDALAFAYHRRVAPIFHEEIEGESYSTSPFEEAYAVKASFVDEVIKYIDEITHAEDFDAIEFYNLEEKLGGRINRIKLILALEYMRIDDIFDDSVWMTIESNAPVEAKSLRPTFSPKDVFFG